jgi:glycosyltransferase 2 family protein
VSSAQRWRLLFGAVLALGLLVFFFRGTDWSRVGSALRAADPGWLLGVIVATIVSYLLRAWRWGYLLSPMARVRFVDLFSATSVGFMSGLLVPRAGEILRPYIVSRRYAVATSAGVATIILERLFDLITVLLLFAVYLYVLPTPAAQTRGPLMNVVKTIGALAGALAVGVLLVLLAFHRNADKAMAFVDRGLRFLPRRLATPLSHVLRAFGGGLAVLQAPLPHLFAIAGQSLLVWLAICASLYGGTRAFGLALPFRSAFLMIAFLTVGVAIPTPGMVGGFHGFYILVLTQAFGAPEDVAKAAAFASHALTNLPVLLLGLAFLGREGLTMGKVAQMAGAEEAGNEGGRGAPRFDP